MIDTLSLLVLPLILVVAAIGSRLSARVVAVPAVVFEIVLGVIAGPDMLGWVQDSEFLSTLSQLGVTMLFFVAGTEIEPDGLRGRTGRRAWLGWFISIGAGVGVGYLIEPGLGALIIGIALASTALGTLLPILRDNGDLGTPFGKAVGAIGTVGEFGPIIAISVFLGTRNPGVATAVLIVFALIAALAIRHAQKAHHPRLHRLVESTLHTSSQFAVRAVLAILALLVALTIALKIDMLLGAFTAGILWKLLMAEASVPTRHVVETKIDALAFGFLVPVFFVHTGITFDLKSLLQSPTSFAMIPLVTLALLVVRGIPSTLAAPEGSSIRQRAAVGLMGATGLPIIVVTTGIGVAQDLISTTEAAVFVGAGVLSVLLFPIVSSMVRGKDANPRPDADPVRH